MDSSIDRGQIDVDMSTNRERTPRGTPDFRRRRDTPLARKKTDIERVRDIDSSGKEYSPRLQSKKNMERGLPERGLDDRYRYDLDVERGSSPREIREEGVREHPERAEYSMDPRLLHPEYGQDAGRFFDRSSIPVEYRREERPSRVDIDYGRNIGRDQHEEIGRASDIDYGRGMTGGRSDFDYGRGLAPEYGSRHLGGGLDKGEGWTTSYGQDIDREFGRLDINRDYGRDYVRGRRGEPLSRNDYPHFGGPMYWKEMRSIPRDDWRLFEMEKPDNTWVHHGLRGWDLPSVERYYRPRADIIDDEDKIRVELEMPGVHPDDIRITVRNDLLTVLTTKAMSKKERSGLYLQNERHYGHYYRQLRLPEAVNNKLVNAVMEEGVLKLTMPKSSEGSTERIVVQHVRPQIHISPPHTST